MNAIQQLKNAAGDVLRIYYDVDAESPRSWGDPLGQFVVRANCKYAPAEYDAGLEFSCRDDDENALDRDANIAAWLPVYVYDHSGVAMNCSGFRCTWDSGQIGFIVATRDQVANWYPSWKRITTARRDKIMDILRGEVETYSRWLNGEVFGYAIENADGSEGDSCWGYYDVADIKAEHPEFNVEVA